MRNIFTVDVEDWFHTNGLDFPPDTWHLYEDRIYENTMKCLDLLDESGVKATFFILGCVARDKPALVREVISRGHEVGSHGSYHQMVDQMTLEEFRADLRFSLRVLEDAAGIAIPYFRAPSWSISPARYEALVIMEEEGIVCDSSLQPFATPLSGNSSIPAYSFRPCIGDRQLNLIEVPPTVLAWGKLKVPFAGGLYLRFWPTWFSKQALKVVNRERTGMLYLHPWELDASFPRVRASMLIRFAQYYRLKSTESKVKALLGEFTFTTLGEYLRSNTFPAYRLDPTHEDTLTSGSSSS